MRRKLPFLILTLLSSSYLFCAKKESEAATWNRRAPDNIYDNTPVAYGTLHLYDIDAACHAHEIGHAGHDAIFISPVVDTIVWYSKSNLHLNVALISGSNCPAQPFATDPSTAHGHSVTGEFAPYLPNGCAYDITFSCPHTAQGDPHIFVGGGGRNELQKLIQKKIDALQEQLNNLQEDDKKKN